ncbi:MAG: DUF1592 domain-containing protein [Verrucomicrobiales bacterium]|nr:DUF1592 domain-containing protein [Verrucomicrobiales bacterium]
MNSSCLTARRWFQVSVLGLVFAVVPAQRSAIAAETMLAAPRSLHRFLTAHCVECHDEDSQKGGLDLTALRMESSDPKTAAKWVEVYDRVGSGEMPPKKQRRPDRDEQAAFLESVAAPLLRAERQRIDREGRATQRRLNRYEYENTLRDLLQTPWLQLRDALPEDGEAHRFNKVGDVLDISHVQMARYLSTADFALRQAMAPYPNRPSTTVRRYYTRDQRSWTGPMKFNEFNTAPERATFPVLGYQGQPVVRRGEAPLTVGTNDPVLRELEGVGVVASAYEPIEPKWNEFKAPVSGRYRLRFLGHTVWVGPGDSNKWYVPNLDQVSKGRRDEPITITAETPPRLLRHLGDFDLTPEPEVHELVVDLLAGEMIRPDAGRLFRSRPGSRRWQNPLAEKDGQPGVVFRWMEVEGPLIDSWPPPGHQLLFGDLPMVRRTAGEGGVKSDGEDDPKPRRFRPPPGVEVVSQAPEADAARLLANFIRQAYRRPVSIKAEVKRFLPVFRSAVEKGNGFTDALIAAYTAVLCSPEFLCLKEEPGRLDEHALAARLSYFLWNSPPDAELRRCADRGELRKPEVLQAQADRLLDDPKARRFIEAFLDYWLDLRRVQATAPDANLYSDYYLDDLLTESATEEPRSFFGELLRGDLPARNVVSSDFAMLNERLAAHYGLPPVAGIALKKTPLPTDGVRGGLLTQAAVLKVTANGTTTSPVVRGAWIMERILGQKPPPPPPSVPAVEPDIRGATTIRQQLDRHRTLESCRSCHIKIDPPGFALENFDVMGGWRDRYRSEAGGELAKGIAKSGQPFEFHYALPVDASGALPDGRPFADIRDFKRALLEDDRQIARNLARQFVVYATGAPVGFADRPEIEALLDRAASSHYGVRTLVRELVRSDLFQRK